MEKTKLESIIKESLTKKEVIIKLGLRAAGGNYKTLDKYIKEYNIDISHFQQPKDRCKKAQISITIPLEQVLIEHSTYNRNSLKKRLYKLGLKKPICEFCTQDENWRGKKISLILDHINGVYDDNRLENLRILCPNCNATLDTHCAKNLKNKKPKKDSNWRSKPRLSTRKTERPPIEQLLKEVEELGFSAVGRKYGVSDNAIRKWIKINYDFAAKK